MFILASASPRRQELISFLTTDFVIKVPQVDETLPHPMPPGAAVEYLSSIKARAALSGESIVIGADTVVALGSEILGKPRDEKHAFGMLKSLSGKQHSVFTGVTLANEAKHVTFHEETKVQFYSLSDDEIWQYIKTGEPMDKAGAYGIQSHGALLVRGIVGDYFNVVGLPISRLKREIEKF